VTQILAGRGEGWRRESVGKGNVGLYSSVHIMFFFCYVYIGL